jgi:type I restriction enzyme, S subunit
VKTCKSVDIADWLTLALTSPIPQQFMRQHIRASSQPDLGLRHIRQIPIPVPPLRERQQIVGRVRLILTLDDKLKNRISAAEQSVKRSSQALLAKAFRGELDTTESLVASRNHEDSRLQVEGTHS